jgi:3',5'-cyclic-AMP phosphodiesterase
VAREQPDVIFVSGDTGEAGDVVGFFERLERIAPTYGVLGNHDYYCASIAAVRDEARGTGWWLPARGAIRLTGSTTLVGVDGWGDARCGDLASRVVLSDWHLIDELDGLASCAAAQRCRTLQALGEAEAVALRDQLVRIEPPRELLVVTHVPPFADACWHDGQRSAPDWLPWFTCIAVGEVLLDHARRHPATQFTVLCGHTHGRGEHRAAENLLVRTGGWAPGAQSYGNPLVQATFPLA